jgi:hypothetical protein
MALIGTQAADPRRKFPETNDATAFRGGVTSGDQPDPLAHHLGGSPSESLHELLQISLRPGVQAPYEALHGTRVLAGRNRMHVVAHASACWRGLQAALDHAGLKPAAAR